MILTLLPVYCLRQGFSADIALAMVSTVVVGDALLQLPIGALADRLSRRSLFTGCAVALMLSSLAVPLLIDTLLIRSEEHTSELQSLMRISYAVFCLKKKKTTE